MRPLLWRSPEAGAYLRAWRHARAGGAVLLERGGQPQTRGHFLAALERRINARAGEQPRWRRLDPLWQVELARDAQELRDHAAWRRRLWGLNGRRWRTDVVQRRLGHLISFEED